MQLFCKTDGPLLTLEHTGVALAAAACLPEGPVVPMNGAGFTVFYQPVGPSS